MERHYRPVDYAADKINDEIHYAVPEHWHERLPPRKGLDKLDVVGTSFKEPDCKNLLCSLDESNSESKFLVNWHGPGPKGKIVTTGWDPETMEPPQGWNERGHDGGKRDASDARRVLLQDEL